MERIYVNVGKRDGFFAGNLIELLNRQIQGKRIDVGRIDLLPAYTLFDVNKKTPAKSSEPSQAPTSSANASTAKSPTPPATTPASPTKRKN